LPDLSAQEDGVSADLPCDSKRASLAMERYVDGDGAAFGDVYRALGPPLLAYLRRKTRDNARATDLVQQAMLQLHLTRGRFVRGSDVVPWAWAIARRVLIDDARRARRDPARAPSGSDPYLEELDRQAPVDERLHQVRSVRAAVSELAHLPEPQRTAFELVKLDGLTMREAAKRLGTTINAVKLRTHRACIALRAASR
jgi:RNA polymerase sigma-70 factor (ECF subfamily)